jgi:hypothetical protein
MLDPREPDAGLLEVADILLSLARPVVDPNLEAPTAGLTAAAAAIGFTGPLETGILPGAAPGIGFVAVATPVEPLTGLVAPGTPGRAADAVGGVGVDASAFIVGLAVVVPCCGAARVGLSVVDAVTATGLTAEAATGACAGATTAAGSGRFADAGRADGIADGTVAGGAFCAERGRTFSLAGSTAAAALCLAVSAAAGAAVGLSFLTGLLLPPTCISIWTSGSGTGAAAANLLGLNSPLDSSTPESTFLTGAAAGGAGSKDRASGTTTSPST